MDGAGELTAGLAAASAGLRALDPAPAAGSVLDAARTGSPVRTGFLRDSHAIQAAGIPGAVQVVAEAPYAVYVHNRNPWLARALDDAGPAVLDHLAGQVADLITPIGN